ncbi:Rop family plasmid primer RNA-binding protein, partial [Klebsiella pneumoniae]
TLLLLEKLNELDLDTEADMCERLHEDAEQLFRTLAVRLDDFQVDL